MVNLALSMILTARRCRELSHNSTDDALRIIAKHLDLPMEDSESVDFLRQAFHEVDLEIRISELKDRIARIERGEDHG